MNLFDQAGQISQVAGALTLDSRQLVTGLEGSAKSVWLAGLLKQSHKNILYVTANQQQVEYLNSDLVGLVGEGAVQVFPAAEVLAAEVGPSSPEALSQRIQALARLTTGQPTIVLTTLAGVQKYVSKPDQFTRRAIMIDMQSQLDLTQLAQDLVAMGYVRQKLVASPGEFVIRGDIFDVFPINASLPYRIELFDTDVDSLRSFDPETQRSVENLEQLQLLPATDLMLTSTQLQAAAERLTKQLAQRLPELEAEPQLQQNLQQKIQQVIDLLDSGGRPDRLSLFLNELQVQMGTLLDYFASADTLILDDYPRILEQSRNREQEAADWQTQLLENGDILRVEPLEADFIKQLKKDQRPRVYLSLFQKGMGRLRLDEIVNLKARVPQKFFSQMPMVKTEMDHWAKSEATVVVLIDQATRLEKVASTFRDFEINSVIVEADQIKPNKIQLTLGQLQSGFEQIDQKTVVLTETELFNQPPKKKVRSLAIDNAERIKSYNDLKPGDYVVHVNHGIGKFLGTQTMAVDGVHRDYLTILYQNNAKLFIPVTQLNLVQKYVASEGKAPHINKLGGTEWQKTKRRVASKIEDIADDLIELYAKRESEKGFAFSPDNAYQHEFEAAFPYTETADQLRSVAEIKHDMERSRPMDRLLVGDVGFGKTEVALRAAFKAVQDNKQVAFLVPTTILAQQHFETMTQRFADFPVNIGVLSRFQSRAQVTETLKKLKNGQLDIVVGTHRLLSQDVRFSDLGLLIIDEEQRFGVKHKEKIKQLRANIDVLTLTATPIPRTLNMSMVGVRDLSVIETPPTNRYPIQTYVMEQNAGAIREAIKREIERNGQVFYLHNRVSDIERVVDQLQQLVPEATIVYAHGQMTEVQLENVIMSFVNGEADVLVATTIIESGIDMPNANTMIVENADHYGLSQLYQLRGRVGRSSRVAYAYFTYKPDKVLTEVSEKRLQAIKDFTELGSGFKIAMRDLSIRGAGNLLGAQQHGFIDSVGYDLYSQMLSEAVAKKKGDAAVKRTDSEIDLKVEAYIPSDYIEDEQQKIEMYKRIRQIDAAQDIEAIEDDLIDRFGDYPIEVKRLLQIAELKMAADQALVTNVNQQAQKVTVVLSQQGFALIKGEGVFKALAKTKLHASVQDETKDIKVILTIQPKMGLDDWLPQIVAFVAGLAQQVSDGAAVKNK
ncbi:transcription-repair coupling factor [Lactobacillus sp. CC-MHH1034]|uniref:transcription-repair coupling factor n=1 Tax=Agrilactobacillus fermenti TaxID=2586909 RepID=UPI0038B293C6|nr:transcription-repair coupling factor [Agrilactobacillus fermenti]